ncbi:uncharacterized protein E1O_06610 [Burkholderiales bacterium GJ-E10]|nr:uncharacterized protein E1O_06610 [Burkholderiales bacterium GJ-E10]
MEIKMQSKKILGAGFAVAAALACGAARGDDGVEWKMLGPAWSLHGSAAASPQALTPRWNCQNWTTPPGWLPQAGAYWTTSSLPSGYSIINLPGGGTTAASPVVASGKNLTQVICGSQPPVYQRKGWSQTNPALGLERDHRIGGHIDLMFADVVRDSLGVESLMTGVGREWPVARAGSIEIDGGAVAGLWWRSRVAGTWNQDIRREVVPFVLPALSLQEKHTGLGLNIALAPPVHLGGWNLNPTWTLMVQTTFRIP